MDVGWVEGVVLPPETQRSNLNRKFHNSTNWIILLIADYCLLALSSGFHG